MFRKHIIVIIIAFVVLIGILFLRSKEFAGKQQETQFEELVALEEDVQDIKQEDEAVIMGDVKGEVTYPGVYEFDSETRVHDVIAPAGGFSSEADENRINLAQKIHDEMIIIVPKQGDESTVGPPVDQVVESNGTTKVKINQATKDEIETLSGIGPAKAQAIIDYREENGLFQTLEDLTEVNGIGEKTVENLKNEIIIP